MSKRRILFFSYWYPNKVNRIFPVFIKKHAQSIALAEDLQVLSLSIINGKALWRVTEEELVDECGVFTRQVYIESIFYKVLYHCQPLHEWLLARYIRKKVLPAFQFDIFHSNILYPCAITGSALARKFGARHVITEHWSRLPHFFGRNIYAGAGMKALNDAAAITAVSELLRNVIRKYTNNKALVVIPNTINEDDFYIDENMEKYEKLTFIAVANWTPPKNPFYFLDALEALRIKNVLPDFQLIMVGNGSLLESAKKRTYSFPMICTGILGPEPLRQQLNKSHYFLHGSEYETFSTVIVEALLCGLPCVVSPVGIAAEVVSPGNGFIAENNSTDFESKILSLVNTNYDRVAVAASVKGRYTLPRISKQFSELYDRL